MEKNDFVCVNCQKKVVYCDAMATAHRNHCNFCLWSRHVDEKTGDRLATCQQPMKPVGLTLKGVGKDRYGKNKKGELMLVHQCIGCGKVSINRIAADDDEKNILDIFNNTGVIGGKLKKQLKQSGIEILDQSFADEVHLQLYGDI
ncbi:MAG: RNHCP domain-containing protein [Patescibacteria group bacterium]